MLPVISATHGKLLPMNFGPHPIPVGEFHGENVIIDKKLPRSSLIFTKTLHS
jgi:hypothetical protein